MGGIHRWFNFQNPQLYIGLYCHNPYARVKKIKASLFKKEEIASWLGFNEGFHHQRDASS